MRPVDLLGGTIGKGGDCGKIEGSVPCEAVLSSSRRLPRNDKSPGKARSLFFKDCWIYKFVCDINEQFAFSKPAKWWAENNTKANRNGWTRLMVHSFEASEGNTRWKDVQQNVNRYSLWLVGFKVI